MNKAKRKILELLDANGGHMGGLDLVSSSDGTLARGTVYVHLSTLEDEGLVTSRRTEYVPGLDAYRREYAITSRGRFELVRKP